MKDIKQKIKIKDKDLGMKRKDNRLMIFNQIMYK